MSDAFEALADRLDAIAEDIADAAIDELKAGVRRGDQRRSGTERTLTQARRAVEKAAHLLRHLDHGDAGAGDHAGDDTEF